MRASTRETGPRRVLGALLLYAVNESLRFVGVVYNLIVVGLVIMAFVVFLPSGLAGLARGPRGRP